MRRRPRIVLAAALGAVLVACGLGAVGTLAGDAGNGGPDGGDGTAGEGGRDASEEGLEVFLDAQPIFDAALDTNPANCLAVCDAGVCDGGTCVIACRGGNPCPPDQQVVCPPGVPCEVDCIAANSCNRGVDCTQATRCKIGCIGDNTCAENKVLCTGDSCVVDCKGPTTCNRGVACDAGSCIIRCTGSDSCHENKIECYSDTCSVQCGNGQTACNRGVTCVGQESCTILCNGTNSCAENAVVARAKNVSVTCSAQSSCNRGVEISAGDGGIVCKNDSACAGILHCDGGRCQASCSNTQNNAMQLCCKSPTTCSSQATNCGFTNQGCP